MGADGPTRPHDSTTPRDVLDLLLLNSVLPDHRQAEQSDSKPGQLMKSPEERKGDADDVAAAESFEEEQVAPVSIRG